MIGRCIARYRIVDRLGEGGMATVWKAEDPLLGRTVALKLLSPALSSSDAARRRFLHEALAAGRLDHPGICSVHDAGESDGFAYMALSWIDGHTVSALAERCPLAISDAIRLGTEAADALGHAHAHGVIHRDVTGRNIMIGRDGRIVVLDFGLALAVGHSRLTSSGVRQVGTPAYLAPEVVSGGPADARSDLYGLGVVLYEALTGTLPFTGPRTEAIAFAILNEPPQPPNRRRRDIPPELEAIVMRLLAKKPPQRFRDAPELILALRRVPALTVPRARAARRHEPLGPASAEPRRYLAIMPFEATGIEEPESLLFVRGLAEVVGTAIGRHTGVQVIPPSVASAIEERSDLQAIAHQVGANQILQASVRKSGLQMRATWSLVEPARGIQIAGETVEGAAGDEFGLEDRLVDSILVGLGERRDASAGKPPPDPAARERLTLAIGYLQRHEDEASVDAAVAILERLHASEPPTVAVEAALGRAYLRKYQLAVNPRWESLAAAACERAIAIDPRASEALVTLGDLCAATGQNRRAIEAYEQVIELEPDHSEAMVGLGRTLIAENRLSEAERHLRLAVARRPNFWSAHNALGRFFVRVGRYEEALRSFERVVQLAPDNALGWQNLVTPLFALERFEDALEACRRSIDIRPAAHSLTTLGSLLFYLDRYAEAVVAFERAIALQPSDALLWGNLGSSCGFIAGHEDRGREALERAITLVRDRLRRNPADARDWARSACWLANLQRYEEAFAALDRALSIEPSNPDILAHACTIHHQAGHRERALHWLREVLSHGGGIARLERDPYLAELRKDPEYSRIVMEERRRQGQGDFQTKEAP